MFAPKWKKEAKLLIKGARKFLHYKRDLLTQDRIEEIESRRNDVIKAVASGDMTKTADACKQLRLACDSALPYQRAQSWFEENIEVMFVAIVIALGLRAYYLQPFRIPTGSMQPTLNGIIGQQLPRAEWPNMPKRGWEYLTRGRSYVELVAEQDLMLAVQPDGELMIGDFQYRHFFSRARIQLANAPAIILPAPLSQALELGLRDAIAIARTNGGRIPKGTVLCRGTVDAGDLVLVDKFSYHFRRPHRGEVFVFDTIGIRGIHSRSGDQAAGSHYIKRLCGVPGDTLTIEPPNLLVNGRLPQEPGIRHVAIGAPPFPPEHQGYVFADPREATHNGRTNRQYLANPGATLRLADQARPGMREYAALGDNSGNSLDSRYWGSVKEYNLVGPALIALWPFTSGHWGFIN